MKSTREKFKKELFFVIRLHDDYLVLSNSAEVIECFLNELKRIGEEYSFRFSNEKIVSNIEADWVANFKGQIKDSVGLDISDSLQITPTVSGKNSKMVSFNYVLGKCTEGEVKNKLLKLMNLSVNLLKNRSLTKDLDRSVEQLMEVQAVRFLVFLKAIRKCYKGRHSDRHISKVVINVARTTAVGMPECPEFFRITLEQFAIVFKGSSDHPVSTRLVHYLATLS